MPSFVPQKGERCFIAGTTGSGKTALSCFLLKRLPDEATPVLIYDIKGEPKFEALKPNTIVSNMEEAFEAAHSGEADYIIVRPPEHLLTEPDTLDRMLLYHYRFLHGMTAYIDEAYPFHRNSQAGPGLTALMTRGRSRGITTIVSSQRPQRISRFIVSEAERAFILMLRDKKDRIRIDDLSEEFSKREKLKKHWFYHIDGENADNPDLYSPIPLEAEFQTGYTDDSSTDEKSEPDAAPGIWI